MWLENIGINLLSNVIFIIIALLIYWGYYLISDRLKLLKFFGIWNSKKITIYVSNLNVLLGGTAGIDGAPYSFQGSAIATEESKAATQLQSLFNYFLPKQVDKPELLNKLLIADIEVIIIPSPDNANAIEQGSSIIVLGSPVYNLAAQNLQNDSHILAKFETAQVPSLLITQNEGNYLGESPYVAPSGWPAGTAVPINKNNSLPTGTPVDPSIFGQIIDSSAPQTISVPQIIISEVAPYRDSAFGFVQRIYDYEHRRSIFYVAGLSDFSTAGCASYLISNWKKLSKKYGNEAALVVLLKIDKTNYNKCQIVFEKS